MNTPETDRLEEEIEAEWAGYEGPDCYDERGIELAKKLERERNEARRECELWRGRFIDERIKFPWENSEHRQP